MVAPSMARSGCHCSFSREVVPRHDSRAAKGLGCAGACGAGAGEHIRHTRASAAELARASACAQTVPAGAGVEAAPRQHSAARPADPRHRSAAKLLRQCRACHRRARGDPKLHSDTKAVRKHCHAAPWLRGCAASISSPRARGRYCRAGMVPAPERGNGVHGTNYHVTCAESVQRGGRTHEG